MTKHSRPTNPRVVLEEDHRRIEALLERLVVQTRADDRAGGLKAWEHAEKAILAHLDVEEMFLVPRLAESLPDEASRIRHEHAEIRGVLGELGLAFELHTARCEAIEAFCASLRAHAEREHRVFYPYAEQGSSLSARSIMGRIVGAVAAVVSHA